MSEAQKSVISFDSANGKDTVIGYYYTSKTVKPHAILQISHGMCEYIGRYADFANYMTEQGYVVCGNDHLGHGATSDGVNGVDGYFADKDGRKYVLQDLHRMNSLVCKAYSGLPLILLGHSMGSFFARLYAATYPETLQALILSGTGGPNPLGNIGIFLTGVLGKVRGAQYRSKFINNLAFGSYLSRIKPFDTQYDWISCDKDIVSRYAADKKCTFVFTVSAFHELMSVLGAVNKADCAAKVNKKLPIYLISGDQDPVGDYGKGVLLVEQQYEDAGVEDVTCQLYPNARHEILNEVGRAKVYEDILHWCEKYVSAKS